MSENNSETVTITLKEYNELQYDSRLLQCLQEAGVDNWSGYDYVDWDYVDGTKDEPSVG